MVFSFDISNFKYECEEVNNINFAFYNEIFIDNMKISPNEEMMIAFWFNIYEYKITKIPKIPK